MEMYHYNLMAEGINIRVIILPYDMLTYTAYNKSEQWQKPCVMPDVLFAGWALRIHIMHCTL